MNPSVTVIIPCRDDAENCVRTVARIRETSPNKQLVQIIVVLDGDTAMLDSLRHDLRPHSASVLSNEGHVLGCAGSRHHGALKASGNWILFTDAHMNFPDEWMAVLGDLIAGLSPADLLCTTYCSRESWDTPVDKLFTGATVRHAITPGKEGAALLHVDLCEFQPGRFVEVHIPVGAGYLVNREFYLRTAPLFGLNAWGVDEEMLAIKHWSHGGRILCSDQFRLEHVHIPPRPGRNTKGALMHNKLILLSALGMDIRMKILTRWGVGNPRAFDDIVRFHEATMGKFRDHPLFQLVEDWAGDIEDALEGGVLV